MCFFIPFLILVSLLNETQLHPFSNPSFTSTLLRTVDFSYFCTKYCTFLCFQFTFMTGVGGLLSYIDASATVSIEYSVISFLI